MLMGGGTEARNDVAALHSTPASGKNPDTTGAALAQALSVICHAARCDVRGESNCIARSTRRATTYCKLKWDSVRRHSHAQHSMLLLSQPNTARPLRLCRLLKVHSHRLGPPVTFRA